MRLLPLSLLLTGCFGLVGNGHQVTETRRLDRFDRVENRTLVRVEVTLGRVAPAELTCDENLLPRLHTDLVDGTLVIRSDRGIGLLPSAKCTLEVGTDNLVEAVVDGSGGLIVHGIADGFERASNHGSGPLRLDVVRGDDLEVVATGSGGVKADAVEADVLRVDLDGSGPIDLLGVDAEQVRVRLDGSGHLLLEGRTDLLDASLSGSGGLHAGDLDAVDARVDVSGSGSAVVHASGEVSGRLTGSGNLEVKGGADVDVDRSGSGRVIRR